MNFLKRLNRNGDKYYFYYDLGRGAGQRPSTGIFIFKKPKTQTEKNHNKESLLLLDVKKSQLTLERQSIGTGFIPSHKYKANFLDYYQTYVTQNKRSGNRHLESSLTHFKNFIGKDAISPLEITENLCLRFRQYLLDRFTGDTPANYYARFKRVLKAATKEGYYRNNPSEEVTTKSNPSIMQKENLEAEEYIKLLQTPCFNQEVREAFIFCCYTGLRHIDVKGLQWEHIKGELLTTKMIQSKTGKPLVLTLHSIAKAILEKRKKRTGSTTGSVFNLPTHDGCNKVLQRWVTGAGIEKHITWHCARLSFSILLQDENVDAATVALLLGHTTTKYVNNVYKRHRVKDHEKAINRLPAPDSISAFLNE